MISQALLPGTPELVESVICPTIDGDSMTVFSCSVSVAGYPMEVTVVGPDFSGGVKVSSSITVIQASELANRVAERLEEDLEAKNSVMCEPQVRVAVRGQKFNCTAFDSAGRKHPLLATLLDDEGSFRIDVPVG